MQVVVVLSGSMEPAYYRGDILFLTMGKRPVRVGEVVVFNIEGRDIPIVHRVVKVHERRPGARDDDIDILTKVCPKSQGCSTIPRGKPYLLVAKLARAGLEVSAGSERTMGLSAGIKSRGCRQRAVGSHPCLRCLPHKLIA